MPIKHSSLKRRLPAANHIFIPEDVVTKSAGFVLYSEYPAYPLAVSLMVYNFLFKPTGEQ
ncbi:hypothetical protein CXP54_07625 [Escherichia albertii]|nr:hypothetical protein CXP54_07625 [Escherichia albertii]EAB1455234.1 hypothetical protein [Escherichia albertii]EEW7343034.1 hypothetical protein [Escherichia albertii]